MAALACPAFAQNLQDQLVGVWRYQDKSLKSKLIIQPGGRYDKLDRNSGSQMQFSGPISVTLNPPTMSLNIQNYSPKEWCGPLGCTPIRMLAVETYRFRVSQNELLLIGPKGGRWQYKRIQQGSR